jgi:serine protease Do
MIDGSLSIAELGKPGSEQSSQTVHSVLAGTRREAIAMCRKFSSPRPAVIGAACSVLMLATVAGCDRSPRPETAPQASPATAIAPRSPADDPLVALSQASQRVAAAARKAVVRIDAELTTADGRAKDDLNQLFGAGQLPAAPGQGSGVIVSADGDILTNYHVLRSASRVRATIGDGPAVPARVVGCDALTDLALLKVDARDLPVIAWGDSDGLGVGAFVWAVGSPYALECSVSFGIVSAKDHESGPQTTFQDFLQTDAALHPGHSGGALVDATGRLVGINTAIVGPSFQGLSFAIPGNTARAVYERLKSTGRIPRGWLGVSLDAVTPERAVQLQLPEPRGAVVTAVAADTDAPARRAGLRAGDVIIQWNGQPMPDPIRLSRLIAQSKPGSSATATIVRDGTVREIPLVLGEKPDRFQ